METRKDALFFTWTSHRRTTELARALGVQLEEVQFRAPRPIRYLLASAVTVATLVRARPRVVFVQNPSIVLAALVCALKRLLGYAVVVDRHSNFSFEDTDSGPANRVSNYSLRRADLTIVTNEYVKNLVESKGGRTLILPDKLPTLSGAHAVPLPGRLNVVFVSTFSPDEPLGEVLAAARLLESDVRVYITGNDRRLQPFVRQSAPPNVVFTGFMPTNEYESLLASADLILELTTRDHTLLCGAYEAVSLGKPLVISRTQALLSYFRRGAIDTENRGDAIANAVMQAAGDIDRLRREVVQLQSELQAEWLQQFRGLEARLEQLYYNSPASTPRSGSTAQGERGVASPGRQL